MRMLDNLLALPEDSSIRNIDDLTILERMAEHALADREFQLLKDINIRIGQLEIDAGNLSYRHRPSILQIEPTRRCNCSCIMCSHSYEIFDDVELNLDLLDPVLPYVRIAVVNGLGEPFLYEKVGALLEKLCTYGVKASATTNLQHLDNSLLPLITRCFKRIAVSCDGADRQTYEAIRRGASFDRFKENAKMLITHCPEMSFMMSVVSMRQNILQSEEIVRLAADLGFEEIRFSRLEVNPILENERDSLFCFPNLAARELQKAKRAAEKIGIKANIPRVFSGEFDSKAALEEVRQIEAVPMFKSASFYKQLRKQFSSFEANAGHQMALASQITSIESRGMCHWLAYGAYITASGELYPCGEIVGEYGVPLSSWANDVQNAPAMISLRKMFERGGIPKSCLNCSYLMGGDYSPVEVDAQEMLESLTSLAM